MIRNKKFFFICIFSVFVVLLMCSVSVKIYNSYNKRSYTLYFLDIRTDKLKSEKRVVHGYWKKINNLMEFVNQVILGPEDIFLKNIFPANTLINKIALEDDVLYLDLDSTPIIADAKGEIDLLKSISLLKKNIKANFNRLNDIKILVNGIEPPSISKN